MQYLPHGGGIDDPHKKAAGTGEGMKIVLTKARQMNSIQGLSLRGNNPLTESMRRNRVGSLKGFFMPELIIKNYTILYDECDKELIKSRKWHVSLGWNNTPYVSSSAGIMSRLITDCPKGLLVDHKNHNTLDNRRENLRICTRAQNMWNRKKTCGVSKYKGVCRRVGKKPWVAQVNLDNKKVYFAIFDTEREAAIAYNEKAKEFFGEFACLNIIDEED
jgi:hypothetical protein